MVFNDGIDSRVDPFALFTVYLCALYSAMTIIAVPMVYRYMAVCRYVIECELSTSIARIFGEHSPLSGT